MTQLPIACVIGARDTEDGTFRPSDPLLCAPSVFLGDRVRRFAVSLWKVLSTGRDPVGSFE